MRLQYKALCDRIKVPDDFEVYDIGKYEACVHNVHERYLRDEKHFAHLIAAMHTE